MTIIRDIIDRGREPEEDRPVPAAPGVVNVSTVQGEGTDEVVNTLPTSVTSPSTLGNISESTANALVQTEQPAQMPHATLSYPSLPDTLVIGEGIDSVNQAVRADIDAAFRDSQGDILSEMYAVGELQRALRSQYNSYIQEELPNNQMVERNLAPPPNALADHLERQKAEALQKAAIPASQEGFSGVTRTLAEGNPLTSTSRQALLDLREAMSIDRQGVGRFTSVEPVLETTPADNIVSSIFLPFFLRPLGLSLSGEGVRDARENIAAGVTIGEVSAERLLENLQREGMRGAATDFAGLMVRAMTGGIDLNSISILPEFIRERIPAPPSFGGVIQEARERDPLVENLFTRGEQTFGFEPTELDPFRGRFGEFGQGPLSSAFYLMSLPEGAIQASAYSVLDRYFLPEGFEQPNRFREVLLEGRDFSFTQEVTEDKYMSFIGNEDIPIIRNLPRAGQVVAGFAADLIIGGVADVALQRTVLSLGRATKGARSITDARRLRPSPRAIDDTVQRSANDVLRLPSVPGDDVARLNFQIDNALRNAPIEDNARVLVPELEDAFKRFGVDDARPYRLRTAIADVADERQLSLPFMNTRTVLEGSVLRRGLRAVAGEGGEIVLEPTEALTRLLSLDNRIAELDQLVREVVAPPEQIAEQLTLQHHQAALANSLREQQALSRQLSLPEAQIVANGITQRAEDIGVIRVENNGFIFQSAADTTLDTLLPTIPLEQLQPRSTDTIGDFLLQYRYAPDSVDEMDINLVRRTDETLENLGRVWSVDNGTFRLPQTPAEELGNIHRARALAEEYPTLLSRFGKPVSNRIEAPLMRVDFSSQFDTNELVSAIPAVRPQLLLPPVQDGTAIRKQVDGLQRRITKLSNQIRDGLVRNDLERVIKLRDQLEESTNSLFHMYADNPEIARQILLETQPDATRPIGPASRALGDRYAAVQERFFYETSVLKKLRQDLFAVNDLLEQQRRIVSESPVLERVPVMNEVATKRSQGLTTRTATAEMVQPGANIRIPQLVDLIGDEVTTFRRIRSFEEFAGLTDEQLRRAINNDGRVFIDDVGNIRPIGDADFGPDISVTGTIHYHGTKATTLDVAATSPSNEFGPGLYVSTDKNLARRFARATPAKDLIDNSTLTPRFTNQGRIFPVELTDDFVAIDIRNMNEKSVENLRAVFRTILRDKADTILSRFDSWSKRHDPHEWWHYVRSQFMRDSGGDVLEYLEFSEEVRDRLLLLGIDGIKDGDTVAVLNRGRTQVFEPFEDAHSTGGIGEGLLNRYAADYDLHNRIKTNTTQAILEQDRLAVDEFAHAQLRKATREQQVITTRAVREYNAMTDQMDAAVVRDNRRLQQINRQESVRDTFNQHNSVRRQVSDIPKEC